MKEGNAQGMNPYAYVAQNPETLTDPSGQIVYCPGCGNGGGGNNNGNPPPPPTPQPSPPNYGPGPCPPEICAGNRNSRDDQPLPTRAKALNTFGIKNGWLFIQGLGEFIGGMLALAAALGLIVGTDGIGAIVEAILPKLEPFLANIQFRGLRDMYASMNDTSPWMRVILDGFVVVTDIWTAVATIKGITELIMQGTFGTTFLARLGQVISAAEAFAAGVENGKFSAYRVGVFVQAISSLAILAISGGLGTYWGDIVELGQDYHDASSGS
jgi:hypothetical protein